MGRKKGRSTGPDGTGRRGKRRSIRFEAVEDREADAPDAYKVGAPPSIMLRKLPLVEALERLETQLAAHAHAGISEVLVVHGRGTNSPGGESVLGPAARKWCEDHPGLVARWREAPSRWGGTGAIIVELR